MSKEDARPLTQFAAVQRAFEAIRAKRDSMDTEEVVDLGTSEGLAAYRPPIPWAP